MSVVLESWRLLQTVKRLLQDLPILEADHFFLAGFVDLGFVGVLGRARCFVENAEVARPGGVRQFVGGVFVGDVVGFRDEVEFSAFAGVRRIESAFVEFHAFAQAFDDAEAVVIHGGFHHLEDVIGIRVRGARDEGGAGRDQLFHRVDRLIHRAPDIGLALETNRRSRAGLFFGQAVDEIIHDDIGHLDVFARGVIDVIAANRKCITIAAKNEHMNVRSAQRNAAREGQGAAVNVVGAVGLHEIREATGAADAGDRGDFLVPHFALFNQLEIQGQHREVAATGAPRWVIGRDFFLGQPFAFFAHDRHRRDGCNTARGGFR